jgi:hypothetical protein
MVVSIGNLYGENPAKVFPYFKKGEENHANTNS